MMFWVFNFLEHLEQEYSKSTYLRQGNTALDLDSDSGSRNPPK